MGTTLLRRLTPPWQVLLVAALLSATSCQSPQDNDTPPNVIIIVMDTSRQDHFSCFGYGRPTTPNLEQLCTESRRYNRAYSTGGWTPPAHASLFTGLYAIAHGTNQTNQGLSRELTTLAEILTDQGYHSVGISENPMLNRSRAFEQGFLEYYETWQLPPAEENHALDLFRASLAARDPEKPFFTFINFIEPHAPYDSSRQFRTRFITDPSQTVVGNMRLAYALGELRFTPAQMEHLLALYDAEFLYVDYLIGKIIEDLKGQDLWENTVFIVTSDHGENFGEHDLTGHVFSLHEPIIHIPLIVHYPREFKPGSQSDHLVQLVDIFPTVLSLTGVDQTPYPHQGIDLRDSRALENRIAFCEYYYPRQALGLFPKGQKKDKRMDRYRRHLTAVIDENMKYIRGSDGRNELYDLAADPTERTNLIAEPRYGEVVRELDLVMEEKIRELSVMQAAQHESQPEQIDEKTERALRSLGYVR